MAHTPQMHDPVTCIFLPDSSIATSLASGECQSGKEAVETYKELERCHARMGLKVAGHAFHSLKCNVQHHALSNVCRIIVLVSIT